MSTRRPPSPSVQYFAVLVLLAGALAAGVLALSARAGGKRAPAEAASLHALLRDAIAIDRPPSTDGDG